MVNSKKSIVLILLIGLVIVLTACGDKEYKPEAINEEVDRCEICNMAIGDNQYATQIVMKDGRSLKFDDIGDMYNWINANGTDAIGTAFVRDYHNMNWLWMENAYYVYDASFRTPMAYGVLSFEKEDDARAFIEAEGKGTLIQADALSKHSWERNNEMNKDHAGHKHTDGQDDGHTDEHDDSHMGEKAGGHMDGQEDSHMNEQDSSMQGKSAGH